MSEHSPTPWAFDDNEHIIDAGGHEVLETSHLSCEDIDLILDSVNALAGLNPEAVKGLVEACHAVLECYMDQDWCFSCERSGHNSDCVIEQVQKALAELKE